MISEFQGDYRFLSNFYPCGILYEGITYPTVEHAYQALKSNKKSVRTQIAKLKTPGQAKRAGATIPDFDVVRWNECKVEVMRHLLEIKFNTPFLKTLLLRTGNEELQEGNRWGDTFWGVDLRTMKGQNHLGKLIMEIRSKLLEDEQ